MNGAIVAQVIFYTTLVSTSKSLIFCFYFLSEYILRTIDACQDVGLPFVEDLNSPKHPTNGCGLLHYTRDQNQHRHSTYRAFLPKALALERRNNLHIATNIIVENLDIAEKGPDGPPYARGVNLLSRRRVNTNKYVKAKKEIILCAGPFGSPHILMLSGIGPSDHLMEKDIKVVKDLPAVGSNLVRASLHFLYHSCIDIICT